MSAIAMLLEVARLGGSSPPSAERPPLRLIDRAASFGCREVEGSYIVLVKGGLGSIVLSSSAFPGSSQVGSVVGSRVRFSFPGLRMREYELEIQDLTLANIEISGMWVRNAEAEDATGCVGFDHEDFEDAKALGTYVRWAVEDVLLALPAELRAEQRAPRLSSRRVTLEVATEGRAPACLSGRGGKPIAFQFPGSGLRYLLEPVALDSEGSRVFIRVTAPEAGFGQPCGRLVATPGGSVEASALCTDPPLRIRVLDTLSRGAHCLEL